MRLTMLVLFLSLAAFGQQPPEGPPPGGPPPGKRMPMPEPKNLKLLKPEHLMETMQSFRVALGVRCDFCHVQNDFASDEKPHKEIARKMIVMSREINTNFPDGKMHVTCYTCHRGSEEPATRSEEHTSELQSLRHLVCRLLLEKKKENITNDPIPQTSYHFVILGVYHACY